MRDGESLATGSLSMRKCARKERATRSESKTEETSGLNDLFLTGF